ncbi:MAG: YihY/virulence factor BrkB family protein [Bacilli bacterium]|nr:YihY/virulence factor BrkB family protein [Bacilli bacterium]
MEQLIRFVKKVIKVASKPEMRVLPGQLAFFFFLSTIPLVALIGAIVANFSIPVAEMQRFIHIMLPDSVAEFLFSIKSYTTINFNIIIFFIIAFILASNGTHSMIITSNEVYKIESSHYIRRRLKAIGMVFILVGVLVFLMLVPAYGDTIFKILYEFTDSDSLIQLLHSIYRIFKYPLSVVVIYFNIKLLYVMAPDKKIKSRSTTKGALFTTISWIIATEIYMFYVNKFAAYDLFYGSISNVIVLLLWMYILSYFFVLGIALNVSGTKEEDIERTRKISLK